MIGREPAPVGIGNPDAVGNTHQGVVRFMHIGIIKITIIGRDQRQIVFIGQIDQGLFDIVLDLHPMAHQLNIEPARKMIRENL